MYQFAVMFPSTVFYMAMCLSLVVMLLYCEAPALAVANAVLFAGGLVFVYGFFVKRKCFAMGIYISIFVMAYTVFATFLVGAQYFIYILPVVFTYAGDGAVCAASCAHGDVGICMAVLYDDDCHGELPPAGYGIDAQGLPELLQQEHMIGDWCVAIVDIDDFKTINDSLGHMTGDEVLRMVADTMKAALRKKDVIVRWGGRSL